MGSRARSARGLTSGGFGLPQTPNRPDREQTDQPLRPRQPHRTRPAQGKPRYRCFAAIPRVLMAPDNTTFTANVVSTYNVIEAAVKLGIKKIIVASSETTYGVVFADTPREPDYFPLDEEYDVNPMDSYALSKVINEQTARALRIAMDGDGLAVLGRRVTDIGLEVPVG